MVITYTGGLAGAQTIAPLGRRPVVFTGDPVAVDDDIAAELIGTGEWVEVAAAAKTPTTVAEIKAAVGDDPAAAAAALEAEQARTNPRRGLTTHLEAVIAAAGSTTPSDTED